MGSSPIPIRAFLCLATLLGVAAPSHGDVYFVGTPTIRVDSSSNATARNSLTQKEKASATLVITREGEDFHWSSRDGLLLRRSQSGIFEVFVAENGAGIIKIEILDLDTFEPAKPADYFETMHVFLGTLTYFGSGLRKQ
jgi:hypothetical protein